ncbi:protein MGA1-like [Diaphorina citri]|uniref:Protein MGA1-like n=1 Tax=Diaphorina citri TaxID=121845 RepID=A0A3Q0IJH2_DIACI|nr:protein MGA1-like [Diaphorina citri]
MQVPLIASNPSQPSFPSGAAPPISGLQPQVPVSNSSNKQGPNSYGSASNVMQVPLIASNPSQPSGAAPPISGLQPQVPVSNNSLQTPLGSSNMMRPPLVTNRFQAPGATINSLSTPVPQQFQRPQQQNANHSQQTFRMPPNTYCQSSKTAPFNNGLTPLTNASLYQQQQQQQQPIPNIPPLPNSQQNSSNFQPSNNLYNNIQVPPRAQPGNYPSVPAGYPSLNQAGYQQQQQQRPTTFTITFKCLLELNLEITLVYQPDTQA